MGAEMYDAADATEWRRNAIGRIGGYLRTLPRCDVPQYEAAQREAHLRAQQYVLDALPEKKDRLALAEVLLGFLGWWEASKEDLQRQHAAAEIEKELHPDEPPLPDDIERAVRCMIACECSGCAIQRAIVREAGASAVTAEALIEAFNRVIEKAQERALTERGGN